MSGASDGDRTSVPTVISADGEALRVAFNVDSDKARILLLLSPTCDLCRQGASVVQRQLLNTIGQDAPVRAFVIWTPILADDQEAAACAATALVPDTRAAHFWDGGRAASAAFHQTLGLPDDIPAWDVYLVYGSGVRWTAGDTPPNPAYWQHQLTVNIAPCLHGPTLAAELSEVMSSVKRE